MLPFQTRSKTLYVIGYADYIDQFNNRHRAGYARRYNPVSPQDNLHIAMDIGYNYDRLRNQGEGNDWNNVS
jgi:hypothetical protein